MNPTPQTHQFLHDVFSKYVNPPEKFEFNGTRFVAIYANGKRIQDFEFGVFRGIYPTWRGSFEKYLDTFQKDGNDR